MRFGICAPFQQAAALHTLSFDYLEENVQRFLCPEETQEAFEALWQAAHQLSVPIEAANSFFPATLPLIDTPTRRADSARIARYVKTALQRAEQVGIKLIVFGSGNARACPEGVSKDSALQQLGEYLITWNEWGKQHGVEIVLEPLRYEETNILNTVAECGTFVTHLENSNVKVLVDTYHMAYNEEDTSSILPYIQRVAHVHVAEKEDRAAPGQRGFDFRPYFSALQAGHYNRRISVECHWGDFTTEVEQAIATLHMQWGAATT
ncbi:MAG TPA: sugar phosphate isomerase/epimerase family protein [Ktedonobacteraceae bacterium]|jgi:sugar phosphate isomerase/epimerase